MHGAHQGALCLGPRCCTATGYSGWQAPGTSSCHSAPCTTYARAPIPTPGTPQPTRLQLLLQRSHLAAPSSPCNALYTRPMHSPPMHSPPMHRAPSTAPQAQPPHAQRPHAQRPMHQNGPKHPHAQPHPRPTHSTPCTASAMAACRPTPHTPSSPHLEQPRAHPPAAAAEAPPPAAAVDRFQQPAQGAQHHGRCSKRRPSSGGSSSTGLRTWQRTLGHCRSALCSFLAACNRRQCRQSSRRRSLGLARTMPTCFPQ